jgi:type II secretory ATPase GspE/PulE/Tfp pilus assembly ATPase PilB-like protein
MSATLDRSVLQRRRAQELGIRPEQAAPLIAKEAGLTFCAEPDWHHDPASVAPLAFLSSLHALPLNGTEGVTLATTWAPDASAEAWARAALGIRPIWVIVSAPALDSAFAARFGVAAAKLEGNEDLAPPEVDVEDGAGDDAAAAKLVEGLLSRAAGEGATDIHVEPWGRELAIRMRVDGELEAVPLPSGASALRRSVVARLKVMAKLDLSERRTPQDGRFTAETGGRRFDVRVSTLPAVHGESVSLRLLETESTPPVLAELGLPSAALSAFSEATASPHGIIVVTGPTGSGKTTTLAALMRSVMRPGLRAVTVEDPVERELPGAVQVQVRSELGLGFAQVLRSVLRQDPDLILIGEIRDRETADIAVRASLTGHLVLTTLHANDSAGAVERLRDLGVEPFLLASSLRLAASQRLVRKICPECAKKPVLSTELIAAAGRALGRTPKPEGLREGAGCRFCRGGYRGRTAIAEALRASAAVRALIANRASATEVRTLAISDGMVTLPEEALRAAEAGITTLAEAALRCADAHG